VRLTKPRRGAKRNIADLMLTCYAEATGASKASITYDCIIERLNGELARNAGVRKRYEEARAKLLARGGAASLRLVK
jgi:hypothetical protein